VVIIPGDAFFDITNDSYDDIDLYVGGLKMDTIPAGTTFSYDFGAPAVYNVQIYKAGTSQLLNNDDVAFPSGDTTWDVYDNAPVVTVQNNTTLTTDESVDIAVDGLAYKFAIEDPGQPTVFDSLLLPGETGFILVDINTHTVEVDGDSTGIQYVFDTEQYVDATHLTYTAK
jgi:hypothetical protein